MVTDDEISTIQDVCYHLLKLYCQKSHPLQPLLNPSSSTPSHLDYRLRYFDKLVILYYGVARTLVRVCFVNNALTYSGLECDLEGYHEYACGVIFNETSL